MEDSRNRMLRILSKFQKVVKLKDIENQEVEIMISYPSMENSVEFWDIIYDINVHANKPDNERNMPQLTGKIFPRIIKYVLQSIEQKKGSPLSAEEKDFYYLVIFSNPEPVINAFMEITNLMFSQGDVPKNPELASQ